MERHWCWSRRKRPCSTSSAPGVAAGESYRAIARAFAAQGIVNRAGRPFPFRALAKPVARARSLYRGTPWLKALVPRLPFDPSPGAAESAEAWPPARSSRAVLGLAGAELDALVSSSTRRRPSCYTPATLAMR
jgi:hypothetical protein